LSNYSIRIPGFVKVENEAKVSPDKTNITRDELGNNYLQGTVIKDGLRDILDREWAHIAAIADKWDDEAIEQVYLVGCGGSRAVLEPAKWLLDRYCRLPVDCYTAEEFNHRAPVRLTNKSVTVLGSHSGTTPEIIESLNLAKTRGSSTLSLSQPGTLLSKTADDALTYQSPATNLSKLLMLYLITTELIGRHGDKDAESELREALGQLPDIMHSTKESTEVLGKDLAHRYQDAPGFYIIATGLLAGLAYQFATCNLLEMQWKHAGVWNAAEFRHGPIEIVSDDLPMIFLVGADEMRKTTERALEFSLQHGADAIVLDLQDLNGFHPWLAPFGLHLPLQWFISYMGLLRNHPITTRRYMGIIKY
jgi:fructoselysine 6-phosphate deglycase